MVGIATADVELFHARDDVCYAVLATDAGEETWKLRSKRFRTWLAYRHRQEYKKHPGAQAVQDALTQLEGEALHGGHEEDVHLRLAAQGGRIYLDLCDDEWRVVEVSANGWRITTKPPVRFRRAPGMLALPAPTGAATSTTCVTSSTPGPMPTGC